MNDSPVRIAVYKRRTRRKGRKRVGMPGDSRGKKQGVWDSASCAGGGLEERLGQGFPHWVGLASRVW